MNRFVIRLLWYGSVKFLGQLPASSYLPPLDPFHDITFVYVFKQTPIFTSVQLLPFEVVHYESSL